jgi:hypothetical protein
LTPPLSSPRDRSNLARKAAQTRWSRTGGEGDPKGSPSLPGEPQNEAKLRQTKRKPSCSWIDNRFCLQLIQDSAGNWLIRTPSGLELPASNSEISFWLDIESLRFQLSLYQAI